MRVEIPKYLNRFVEPKTLTLQWLYPFKQIAWRIWFYIPEKIYNKQWAVARKEGYIKTIIDEHGLRVAQKVNPVPVWGMTIEVEECAAFNYKWWKMIKFHGK